MLCLVKLKLKQWLYCGDPIVGRYEREENTYMDIYKVDNLTHIVSFAGKIGYKSSFSVYNESVTVNSGWKHQQNGVIFSRLFDRFPIYNITESESESESTPF